MPKYHIDVDIKNANGTQCWEVEADSPEDALQKYNAGEGDVIHEEIEVTELGEADLESVREAD